MQRSSVDKKTKAVDLWLQSLNPAAKLLSVLLIAAASIIYPGIALSAILLICITVLSIGTSDFAAYLKVMLGFGIPVTIMLLFIQGGYGSSNKTILFQFGFFHLGLEGVMTAIKTVLTLLVILGFFYQMNRTATPSELVDALMECGLSPKAGYLVLASLNVVPQMHRRMEAIQEAQSARGLDTQGGLISRLMATVPLLGPAVLSSLTDAEERSMTLETHGFQLRGIKRTSYREIKHAGSEKFLIAAAVVILSFSLVARFLVLLGLA